MIKLNRIVQILKEPKKFFKSLSKEKGAKEAFKYLAVLVAINLILTFIVSFYYIPQEDMSILTSGFGSFLLVVLIFLIVLWYSMVLAFSFLFAGILHLWVKLFGGRSVYSKTYQLFVYSSVPSLLFNWVPYLGIFAVMYGLYLLIVGTPILNKSISKKKAVLMYVIPIVILFLLALINGYGFTELFLPNTENVVGQAVGLFR